MLKKEYLITMLLALCILSGVGIAAASDVTDADYSGRVRVTNNGTAVTNVSTIFTANTTAWIASGILNSSANNCAVRLAGADIAFMPGYNSSTWVLFIDSISASSSKDATLYAGKVTGGKYALFGTLNAGDAAGMEPSGNYTAGMTAYLDTSQTDYEYLCKPGAYTVRNGNPSGNYITTLGVDDAFTADHWTDASTAISVNTTRQALDFDAKRSATDTRSYLDLGTALSNTTWRLDFDFYIDSSTAGSIFYWGLWSAATNGNGYAGDFITMYCDKNTIGIRSCYGGTVNTSAALGLTITTTDDVQYYCSLERGATGNKTQLSIYSNPGRSTHIAGSPIDLPVSETLVTNLRYIQASNFNDNSDPAKRITGWIDNVVLADEKFVATGGASGEGDVELILEDNPVINGGMETGNPPSNWTAGRATSAQSATAEEGDYSCKVTCNDAGGTGTSYIYQSIPWQTGYAGESYTLYAYTRADSGNDKLQVMSISDGVGLYDSTVFAKDDTFHWVSLDFTLDALATEFTVIFYAKNTSDADADDVLYVDSVMVVPTSGLTENYNHRLEIDGSVVSGAYSNVSVRDTLNSLIIGSNATPYIMSANATVDGTVKASYAWNYSNTITDLSGNGNDATLTPRTTSSAPDVSAALISWTPISPSIASANASTWPVFLTTAPTQPTTMYTENATPGVFFRPLVHAIWTVGMPGVDEAFFWYGFSFFTIIAAGMLIFWAFAEKSKQVALLIKIILMMAIMIFWALPGPNIYGMYVPIYMGMWCFGIIVLSRSYGW